MFSFSVPELGMVLLIALVVFGPGKLPEVGKAIGKSVRELRQAMETRPTEDVKEEAKPQKTITEEQQTELPKK